MKETDPDYSSYTLRQLHDCRKWIDRDRYPDRVEVIEREIARRLAEPPPPVEETSPREKVEPQYRNFWRRFLAGLIDGSIFAPLVFVDGWVHSAARPLHLLAAWFVTYSLLFPVYSILMHRIFGQTVGKMLTRVKVVDLSFGKLTLGRAFFRDLVPLAIGIYRIEIALPVFLEMPDRIAPEMFGPTRWTLLFALSFGWAGWSLLEIITLPMNRMRRALHDLLAGSVVVRSRWPRGR